MYLCVVKIEWTLIKSYDKFFHIAQESSALDRIQNDGTIFYIRWYIETLNNYELIKNSDKSQRNNILTFLMNKSHNLYVT